MDDIPILIGRQMRLAEKPASDEATPEETEALVRETLGTLEKEWLARQRAKRWAWLSRMGWNVAAAVGVALWLLILVPNALAVLATAATGLALLTGLLLCGTVIMLVPVLMVAWIKRGAMPQAGQRPR